jgi:Txe/YoeB family toxin of Txe-Axe toxin-antitoxin module
MNKPINVAFISQKLKEQFEYLKHGKFEDKQLYAFIDRAIDDLKANPLCGIKIAKNLWPKEYVQKYQITNLWKYDLPNAWRLIYTIETDEVKIVSIILEWFDHKEYEKRFKY